ncbi:MAG: zf-HC2 domain-containing protein [Acidobacteria bacterium]|nr:zf-HC2 domain-containing protein [Acidobacteriota bacterium]
MTCKKVRENLWGYHHHQIPDDLDASMRSHLETCADCATELEQFKQVDGALDGFAVIEASPYFDQKLNVRLNEVERNLSGWGWIAVWLKDPFLWTFATLFLAATGLWLGFRHQQNQQLHSMEEVVRLQDESLRPQRTPDPVVTVLPQTNVDVATIPERPRPTTEAEDTVPDEDLAVLENFELLQDYDFLKDLAADKANGGEVETN